MKHRNLKILLASIVFIGLILFIDEISGLHFLGDLSSYDPTGSDYVKHWMVGLLLITISYWYWRKKKL